ncbi:MAG: hypothetical protein DPW09_13890 [Anaerolineae bacterium]|nr:hypothetical protein [Anaerolineales bacterium]MCQ3974528.1 hypothetical protein [Anaerolineae bacterium]
MDSPKVILITGSSSGLDRLTAETLARRGHRVFASMPAEDRPLRSVVAQGAIVENFNILNKVTGQLQRGVMERFGLVESAS